MTNSPESPERSNSSVLRGGRQILMDYWLVLVQRRWIIVSCLGLVVVATGILSLLATPRYRAVTTLQIDRQGPDILSFTDVMSVDPSYAAYQDFYQTQYKILQSRSVIQLAVERLDLPNQPEFATRKEKPITRLISRARSLFKDAQAEVDPLIPAMIHVTSNLTVSPVRNSHLVQVSFTDRNPELAADVANAVAEAYLQFSYRARYDTTAVAREFLTKEVARVQAEIDILESELQDYGTKKEILAVGDAAGDVSQQALSALNARYVEARGRLAVSQARFGSVENAAPDSLPEVLNSPLINSLKQQHAEVERRYTLMSEKFRDDWPALKDLRGELRQARERLDLETANIARQVQEVAHSEFFRAQAEVVNLEKQFENQKVEVQRVNRDTIEYASLRAEIATKRTVLADLVSRQSETQTSERLKDTQTSNIRIVDPAETPRFAVWPKKKLNLVLAIALGTALGIGIAFLFDYLDNTVKREQDIERIAPIAVLGHVPLHQPLRAIDDVEPTDPPASSPIDLASYREPRSAFSEAFRNLRTSLLLASPEHPPVQILVTSCEPQDGKSTVSANLALVLTQLGRRVLLVDADLRKPRLHKSFGLSNDVGLSSVLSGNAEPREILCETELPNLMVATSGPIPPNPSELLGSVGLQAFLAKVSEEGGFDHIVLDSPPVVSVTDPVVLASTTDATIVVVRAGKTARESLAHTVERLGQSRGRIVGAVLNATSEETGHYYGRYRYYHRYERDDSPKKSEQSSRGFFRRHRDQRRARGA